MSKINRNIAATGVVAALYVAITLIFDPISYGVVQLRLSEMFNHLAAFNKRYIFAVTLGVLIVNIFSPLGVVDMIFGTTGTLIGTTLTYFTARNIGAKPLKFLIATLCQLPRMFLVDLEMHLYMNLPLFPTYWVLALGEIASMAIGAVIIYLITKKINLYE
ncbi:QueT transporter family protein [Pediococcus acidilactici]|uniref:QueT transporter family protein n=1 Tax=Pediococcus acidilactici TaxID=1254 RepID=UPI00254AF5DB|nr:QueT transporter family protein [Pediococcus acidilactici]WIL71014.1 QueT transporter family protein [Pediococcus acidilactici]